MTVAVVIGGQWGDEGKGKIVDLLAEHAQYVVRFSAGSNAGHTVINDLGEFRLHLVPAGILWPGTKCIIGNGVAITPATLLEEINMLQDVGVDCSRLFLSSRAHVVMPYHVLLDGLEEEARGAGAIGTTLRGVGPAFADKVGRQGVRLGDLLDAENFQEQLKAAVDSKNRILVRLYNAEPLDWRPIYDECMQFAQRVGPHVKDTDLILAQAIARKEAILLEGAQGTLLDLDFGTYPYVTSSVPSSLAAGACVGAGIGPKALDAVIGVFKAYSTRVGGGPLPTELLDETGSLIRQEAQEYGATTGRPRRCGWFDAVAARYSTRINGCTGVAITRLDVLGILPTIRICVGYRYRGSVIRDFPTSRHVLEQSEPVYEEHPGWLEPIHDARSFDDLPQAAKDYVRRLEEYLDTPADLISVGASREQTIQVRPIFS